MNEDASLAGLSAEDRRKELKRRLRLKVQGKQRQSNSSLEHNPQAAARAMRKDPTTAMLQLGVDDPLLLAKASAIARDPLSALRAIQPSNPNAAVTRDEVTAGDEDDEEEAPPPA